MTSRLPHLLTLLLAVLMLMLAPAERQTHTFYLPIVKRPHKNCGVDVWPGTANLAPVRELGCKYVRYTPGTSNRPGLYGTWMQAGKDWASLNVVKDDLIRLRQYNVTPVVTFFGNASGTCAPPPSSEYREYANFVSEAIDYLSLTHIELWNEPDYPSGHPFLYGCWGTDKADDFRLFLLTVLTVVRQEYPGVVVGTSFGYSSVVTLPMVERVADLDLDFVGFHSYQTYVNGAWAGGFEWRIENFQAAANGLPVWLTETNLLSADPLYCVSATPEFEQAQAAYLAEVFEISRQNNVVPFVYALTTYRSSWRCAALLHDDGTPTAGFYAIR